MHHSILQTFFADSCIDNRILYNEIKYTVNVNSIQNTGTHKQGSENDHPIVFNLIKTAS